MKNFLYFTMLLLTIGAFPALAAPGEGSSGDGGPQGGGHSGGPRQACRDDVQSFCSGIEPGGGRILQCLKDHNKQISDPCYHALQDMASRGDKGPGEPPPPPPPRNGGAPGPDGGSSQPWPPNKSHDGPPPPPDGDAPPPPPNN